MTWLWIVIGALGGLILLAALTLIFIATKHGNETNCERLRRLGERGFYK